MTCRYREFPVPGIFDFFGGIGTNWYRKKVSEPVSVKFGIGKKSRNRYRKNLVPKKGTGISVSKIFSTGKSIGIGIVQHFGYRHTLATGHTCPLSTLLPFFESFDINLIKNDDNHDLIHYRLEEIAASNNHH